MAKVYAICRISGAIELSVSVPDGYIALAVGERHVVLKHIQQTAQVDADESGDPILRVPGTREAEGDRGKVEAIAHYIQALAEHHVPGFRALGV